MADVGMGPIDPEEVTNNKTTLQTNNNKLSANNTDLATILNTINSLPEAGSGGSGGGTLQYVSNDIECNWKRCSSGDTMISVTNLSFAPQFIYIYISYIDTGELEHSGLYLVSATGGLLSVSTTANLDMENDQIYTNNQKVNVNLTNNGFNVVANSSIELLGGTYTYIAIG